MYTTNSHQAPLQRRIDELVAESVKTAHEKTKDGEEARNVKNRAYRITMRMSKVGGLPDPDRIARLAFARAGA